MPSKTEYLPLDNRDKFAGFRLSAPSMERVFILAGHAVTDNLITVNDIAEQEKRIVSLKASDPQTLMTSWLREVIGLFRKEAILCTRIIFDHFDGKVLRATLWGEPYNALRHGTKTEVVDCECLKLEYSEIDEGFSTQVKFTPIQKAVA